MSDHDETTAPSPQSPGSPSELVSPGALDSHSVSDLTLAIRAHTKAALDQNDLRLKQEGREIERHALLLRRIDRQRQDTVRLADAVNTAVQAQLTATGAIDHATGAIDDAKNELDTARRKFEEVTGEHPVLDSSEGAAPKFLQVIVVKFTNFGWKNKAKVAGWVSVGIVAVKHIWDLVTPYLHRWHP